METRVGAVKRACLEMADGLDYRGRNEVDAIVEKCRERGVDGVMNYCIDPAQKYYQQICEKLGGKDEVWYATNIEIYDYTKAYESLIYSADGKMIYNPTVTKIWFDVDGTEYTIDPGQTITLDI